MAGVARSCSAPFGRELCGQLRAGCREMLFYDRHHLNVHGSVVELLNGVLPRILLTCDHMFDGTYRVGKNQAPTISAAARPNQRTA